MKQFIYILTDSNRNKLQVGLTHDLTYTIDYYKEIYSLYFDSHKRTSRLVYFEEILTEEKALNRFKEINGFTRIQKEKMIRSINVNWNDLYLQSDYELVAVNRGLNYRKQIYAS